MLYDKIILTCFFLSGIFILYNKLPFYTLLLSGFISMNMVNFPKCLGWYSFPFFDIEYYYHKHCCNIFLYNLPERLKNEKFLIDVTNERKELIYIPPPMLTEKLLLLGLEKHKDRYYFPLAIYISRPELFTEKVLMEWIKYEGDVIGLFPEKNYKIYEMAVDSIKGCDPMNIPDEIGTEEFYSKHINCYKYPKKYYHRYNRVVNVNVTSNPPRRIPYALPFSFRYCVPEYKERETQYYNRYDIFNVMLFMKC